MAQINGRILREALDLTKVNTSFGRFSNTQWVNVCPTCDAYALGVELIPWPFNSPEGVMCTVDDYEQGELIRNLHVHSFLGVQFSSNAFKSAHLLHQQEHQEGERIEGLGASLSESSSLEDFNDFSEQVCAWGEGKRVWANLLRHHPDRGELTSKMREWLLFAKSTDSAEEAILAAQEIKGLDISMASKHLRMLDPSRYVVLDAVLSEGLGVALTPNGYRLFLSQLHEFSLSLREPMRLADVEAGINYLVRSGVRAN